MSSLSMLTSLPVYLHGFDPYFTWNIMEKVNKKYQISFILYMHKFVFF